ncbi:hypothetical protein HPP92_004756 [Vanilla planifolia]|uniref:U-box domain-containing protein n=1 Tax=Vanilla planifolia TaxID=51239 RepID=A0A835VCK5_VANPL|nr:hypothetical protein HPP92_004756 [Vanilla planifolia]
MASLMDLLAEDGFKRGRNRHKMKPAERGGTTASTTASLHSSRFLSSGSSFLPVRTNSDVNPQRAFTIMSEKGGSTEPRPSSAASRKLSSMDWYEADSSSVREFKSSSIDSSSKESKQSIRTSGTNRRHQSCFEESDVNCESRRVTGSWDGYSVQGNLGYDKLYKNDLYERKERNGSKTQKPNFDARGEVLALDEAELKSVSSLIINCVSQFLQDENLRSSIHRSCLSFVNSSTVHDGQAKNDSLLSTLEEAIGTVEKLLTEGSNQLELKKVFLKLSVIAGLKSMKSDCGSGSGVPYWYLAASAHLYLSILCKIQNKDKASVKHILQIFSDCPYQARTVILPQLWVQLFLPHLSHLKAWRDKEAESIRGTSDIMSALEFLEKVYNDNLDMVTVQFAAYYRSWLIEGNKIPTLPSILIPSASFPETADNNFFFEADLDETYSSRSSTPSQTRISKRLYESVLGQAKRIEMTAGLDDVEKKDEAEEWYLNIRRGYDEHMQRDDGYESQSPNFSTNSTDLLEYYSADSRDWGAPSDISIMQEKDRMDKVSGGSSTSRILEVEDIKVRSEMVQLWHENKGYIHVHTNDQEEIDDELKLKKLSQSAFPSQVAEIARGHFFVDEVDSSCTLPGKFSLEKSSCVETFGDHEDVDNGSLFAGVLKDFFCPLTGLLLKDPVTLETGHTFELVAIKERFEQGNKTCPVTGQSLKCTTILEINIVLKHMINSWILECFRNAISVDLYASCSTERQACKSRMAFFIVEQLLSGFRSGEKENIKHLISIGGADFLVQMLELGSLEDKSRAAGLLEQCIRTDGSCRNHLVLTIRKHSLLELIHSKQVHAKSLAVSLLVELICLNRRMDIISFLSGLQEELKKAKDDLLECLEISPSKDRVLVAVLLIHFDLMEECKTHSAYMKAAVKCIITTLGCCLSDKGFIANCEKALLMLGGHFSSSGEILTEAWLLKQAGCSDNSLSCNDEDDQAIPEEEANKREEWLKNMALALLGYGKKSFLGSLSLCWKSGSPVLVRLCLVTTAWLSHALVSISVPALQFSTFLAFMPRLKECLKDSVDIKDRVLASLCLLNFSRITECKVTIITLADEIEEPLRSLTELTWTAKHLYNDLFDEEAQ